MGGLSISELNLLEFQFLKLNNFQLFVKVEELQKYGNQLLLHCINDNQFIIYYSIQNEKPNTTHHHHVSDRFESIPRCYTTT